MTRKQRAALLLEALPRLYPGAKCELEHAHPFELLVATILSAQCTDKQVNLVTPALFRMLRSVEDFARVPPRKLETLIRSTGFFRNKAKNLRACARAIIENHGGKVPRSLEALAALPGVGRKTANVVLGNAFGINEGMVVDTHIRRLSQRLGLSRHSDPGKIERDLMKEFPRESWTDLSHWLIRHGRKRCTALRPDCPHCEFAAFCPSAGKADRIPHKNPRARPTFAADATIE